MTRATELFGLLADETRLTILLLLSTEGELCVCELTHALDLSQPKVSRHLATLRRGGLVRDRRRGLWVHYRVAPEIPEWILRILQEARSGHSDRLEEARNRLATMPGRPEGACSA